ncbi:MAG: hypothetical protein ACXVCX_16150, partial [Ktedonobacterales bacterium]
LMNEIRLSSSMAAAGAEKRDVSQALLLSKSRRVRRYLITAVCRLVAQAEKVARSVLMMSL